MKGYKLVIHHEGTYYAFYVWADSEKAAGIAGRVHVAYGAKGVV